jgi:uncharacterized tellurite resistance protein B-like protein
MAFFNRMTGPTSNANEAAMCAAIAVLTQDGDLIDIERRVISLFRDEFPPLGQLDEPDFVQVTDKAVGLVSAANVSADVAGFVRSHVAATVTDAKDRLALYRYCYSLAMADLNLDAGELAVLTALKAELALAAAQTGQAEQDSMKEFRALHQALASVILGLMVVAADGVAQDDEVTNVRSQRTLLATIGRLDDTQFDLVFDMALNVHDRFLLDLENRKAFLSHIVADLLSDRNVRLQAFEYAAAVATCDGDIAQSEIDVMKELLSILQISDAQGETIFNKYMAQVRTIDGQAR